MSKKNKWEERREKVQETMELMDKEIEGYFTTPEQMSEYLEFMTKMYNYSPRNSGLIQRQFKGAEAVGSFKFWKDKGFPVNKGEKGIQILTPNQSPPSFKTKDGKWKNVKYANQNEKRLLEKGELNKRKGSMYFTIGHVFDVSQTNAKASDLPEIFPNRWMEGNVEDYSVLMESFEKIAEGLNVTVGDPLGELGSAKGAFYHAVDKDNTIGHIGLNPRNEELQDVKTMIHELAHAKLHSGTEAFKLSTEEKEFQAEMVAYSTASYFGIDTSDYSLRYLANWTQGKELTDKTKLLDEVRDTSMEFIKQIEGDLIMSKEKEHYILMEYGDFGAVESKEVSREEVMEKILDGQELSSIHGFNQEFKEKYTLIDPDEITEPMVVIKWSEASHDLPSNEFIPYAKANEITERLAKETRLGYEKTWYSVLIPSKKDGVDIFSMDRLDIGDGQFMSLHDQVKNTTALWDVFTEKQWQSLTDALIVNTSVEPSNEMKQWANHLGLEHSSTEDYGDHFSHIYTYGEELIDINQDTYNNSYQVVASREVDNFEPYLEGGSDSLEGLVPFIEEIKFGKAIEPSKRHAVEMDM